MAEFIQEGLKQLRNELKQVEEKLSNKTYSIQIIHNNMEYDTKRIKQYEEKHDKLKAETMRIRKVIEQGEKLLNAL